MESIRARQDRTRAQQRELEQVSFTASCPEWLYGSPLQITQLPIFFSLLSLLLVLRTCHSRKKRCQRSTGRAGRANQSVDCACSRADATACESHQADRENSSQTQRVREGIHKAMEMKQHVVTLSCTHRSAHFALSSVEPSRLRRQRLRGCRRWNQSVRM